MLGRFSIRFRLTAWYAVSLALLLGILASASYYVMRASIYRAVDVDLRYRLASVEDEFRETLSENPSSFDKLANEVAQNTQGALFQVFDEAGQLIYQSEQLALHHIQPSAPSLSGELIVFRNAGHEGWRVRLAAQRISLGGRNLIVEIAQPLRAYNASLRGFKTSLVIAIPLMVLSATAVGYWLSGRALAPVNQIVADARAIDSNRLSHRVSVPAARDELRQLSETLNSMLDRIEVSVIRIKQFTADASHELRSPLTLIQTAAEYSLRRDRSQEELTDAMDKILRESKRMAQLIDNLLLLARADSDEGILIQEPVSVNSALLEAVDRGRQLAADKAIEIATEIGDTPVTVSGEPALLQRLFFILIDNAIKYTPERGSVKVSLSCARDEVVVDVSDTGMGIAAEDLPHVFDRFWRADKVRSRNTGGTGLGLAIAKWIAEKSNGTIRVESVLGQGSKFEVRLAVPPNPGRESTPPV
ncbi:MAG TPA: ATP-binding protein [Terriglobales bacterium]|nr:ATP-binding protein [Terriglobales bacterium]